MEKAFALVGRNLTKWFDEGRESNGTFSNLARTSAILFPLAETLQNPIAKQCSTKMKNKYSTELIKLEEYDLSIREKLFNENKSEMENVHK